MGANFNLCLHLKTPDVKDHFYLLPSVYTINPASPVTEFGTTDFSLWDVEPNNVLIETESMNLNPATSSSVNGLDYELLGNVSMDNDIMSICHVPELTHSEWNWGSTLNAVFHRFSRRQPPDLLCHHCWLRRCPPELLSCRHFPRGRPPEMLGHELLCRRPPERFTNCFQSLSASLRLLFWTVIQNESPKCQSGPKLKT